MSRLFGDQSLVVKMMSGFATTAVITLLVGGLGVVSVQQESAALALIYQRHVSGINDLKQAQIELLLALSGQKNALSSYTPGQRDANLETMQRAQSAFATILRRVGSSVADDRER